jgi:hypothetical protein
MIIEFHILNTTPRRPLYVRVEHIAAICGQPGGPAHLYMLGSDGPFLLDETTDYASAQWLHRLEDIQDARVRG